MENSPEDEGLNQKAEALREKSDYESLTNNPGWRRLVKWMNAQEQARFDNIVLVPSTGVMKNQLEVEYTKGEIATMRLIVQIVETGLETATAVVRSLEDDDRTSDSADDDNA